MKNNIKSVSTKFSDGREIKIETGKLAKQADGSVVLSMGKTMILAPTIEIMAKYIALNILFIIDNYFFILVPQYNLEHKQFLRFLFQFLEILKT